MTQTKEEPKIWTALEIYCALDEEEYDEESGSRFVPIPNDIQFISFQDHQKAISELQVENEKLKECASCEFYNEEISSLKQQIENAKKLIIFESNKKVELEKQIKEKDIKIKILLGYEEKDKEKIICPICEFRYSKFLKECPNCFELSLTDDKEVKQ